eukprot:1694564-Rhodomonas_salina.1
MDSVAAVVEMHEADQYNAGGPAPSDEDIDNEMIMDLTVPWSSTEAYNTVMMCPAAAGATQELMAQ